LVIGANGQIGTNWWVRWPSATAPGMSSPRYRHGECLRRRRYTQLNVLDKDGLAKLSPTRTSPRSTSWRAAVGTGEQAP